MNFARYVPYSSAKFFCSRSTYLSTYGVNSSSKAASKMRAGPAAIVAALAGRGPDSTEIAALSDGPVEDMAVLPILRKKSNAFRSSMSECVEMRAKYTILRSARVVELDAVSMRPSTKFWI